MENFEHLPIKFPDMRLNLTAYIYSLSDRQYQQGFWGKNFTNDPNFYDDFDQAIHYLYDTLDLTNQTEKWLNLIFLTQKEIELTQ